MAMVIQLRYGLGGALALVAALVAALVVGSVVVGEVGDLMGTPGGEF